MRSATSSAPPAVRDLSDELLIQRVVAREPDAPGELFRRYGTAMYALSYRLSRDHALAEEAVQDARVQAWRDAARYDPERGNVVSWLLVITRGRTLDRLRARQLRDGRLNPGFDLDSARALDCPVDVALERQDRLGVVDAVLDVLPGADRASIELAFYEGLTHTEIAARLALPLGTAKTQLRRAMQTIRTAVDERPRHPFQWRAHSPSARPVLADAHILVVDDEIDTVKLTTLVLKRAGADVVSASSAMHAIDRVEARWPDVALLDLEMPNENGYALMARLRVLCERRGRPLPTIAFTARADARDREATRAAGFSAHVTKPIRPAVLVERVARLLHH